MPFQKGQSGNPTGRPPKQRALTNLLEQAGNKRTVMFNGKKISRNYFLANAIWQAITEAKVTLPDGMGEMKVNSDDWWNAVQFLYKHIDGPPTSQVDITSAGEQIKVIGIKVDDV